MEHNELMLPEQLPLDALSQIDYGHTRHCEDCLCQQITHRATGSRGDVFVVRTSKPVENL